MKPPIILERIFKHKNIKDNLKLTAFYIGIAFVIALFVLAIVGTVSDTVTSQDKQCVAQYHSVDYDHQSISTGKDKNGNDTSKGVCVNVKTHKQYPANF